MKTLLIFFSLFFISNLSWAQKVIFISNYANPATSLTRAQIRDFYFKKNRSWPNSTPVRFFDRQDSSAVRNIFLKTYIHKTSRQVDQFWIAQKFNVGDSAPTQVSSDSMTISLVSRFPGGVSYILNEISLPAGVKIIEVSE